MNIIENSREEDDSEIEYADFYIRGANALREHEFVYGERKEYTKEEMSLYCILVSPPLDKFEEEHLAAIMAWRRVDMPPLHIIWSEIIVNRSKDNDWEF